ncbi:MAG: M15 family metallopeptidase [Pseudomonadota bacterium]
MPDLKYFETVDEKERIQHELVETIPIKDNNSPLISLKDSGFNLIFEPSIKKDYRYLVRKDIVEKIGRISQILNNQEKVLIIRSVWRSFHHQRLLWNDHFNIIKKNYPNKPIKEVREIASNFVASRKKSMHSTGGAVDALIFDSKTNRIMDFGTNDGYKITLDERCYPYHPDITSEARENRDLLISLFEKEDFVVDLKEYWHFDYGNVIWAIEKSKEYAIYGIIKTY